jgi:hypothetical protein
MRKRKIALPIILMFLAAVLAVLIVMPVKTHAAKVIAGKLVWHGVKPACFCGMSPTSCYCILPEEPGE